MSLYLGHTSLMMAAESGNTDTLRIILEYGADVNTQDVYGKLHILSGYLGPRTNAGVPNVGVDKCRNEHLT